MLGVIERELMRCYYFSARPIKNLMRSRAFAKTEAAGTDLTGSWDETILGRNDIGAYQDASKVLTMVDHC